MMLTNHYDCRSIESMSRLDIIAVSQYDKCQNKPYVTVGIMYEPLKQNVK